MTIARDEPVDFPDDQGEAFDVYKSKVSFLISQIESAARAASFDEAAWHVSNFLHALDRRTSTPLRDLEFEALELALGALWARSESWPPHPYATHFDNGLEAAWTLICGWAGEPICDDPTGPTRLDLEQQARILRNSAHNAVLAQDITARAHKRRQSNVRSLVAARRERGLA